MPVSYTHLKQQVIGDFFEEDGENEETPVDAAEESNIGAEDSDNAKSSSESKEDDWVVQCSASTFFPSQYGISFVVSSECQKINIKILFGNYKKAKAREIALPYSCLLYTSRCV